MISNQPSPWSKPPHARLRHGRVIVLIQNRKALHEPLRQFAVHRISFRRKSMMDTGRDRLRDAESHISPLAPRVALPDGYNARFILEKSSDRIAAQPPQFS